MATDFSARSDRALQRASLLARQFGAALVLVAVIDDDQPQRLLEADWREATALLDDLARTARELAGVECEARVEFGEPFQRIVDVAENIDADFVVLGPHRRQVLLDIFVGTTAERTIRHSQRPVLMANAVPARAYDRIVVATDFSNSSVQAVQSLRRLGFLDTATIVVAHAFEALFQGVIVRSAMTMREHQDYIAREQKNAREAMATFLRKVDLKPARRIVELVELSAAHTIRKIVQRERVNLVVVGTHGKTGAERYLLGSVA